MKRPWASLSTSPSGPANASLAIQTVTPIGGTDLTFSADKLLDTVGAGGGAGSIVIDDAGGAGVVAAADLDTTTGDVTLTIAGTSSAPLALSAGWHTYAFSYDSAGNAAWLIDGASALSVGGYSLPPTMIVSLENNSGSFFNFDTVVITSP